MVIPEAPGEALKLARQYHSQAELAKRLGKTERTIRRWENDEVPVPTMIIPAIRDLFARANPAGRPLGEERFTFADLFAGIGGMRAAFEPYGGRCVYSSEWDDYAVKTYTANYSNGHPFDGDITKVDKKQIPDHDVLLAGFPCQPFSIAGVSKKKSLGRQHGFKDKAQGTLFYDILEVLSAKQPKAFLLENVKNLRGHDGGNTYAIITGALEEAGYTIFDQVIDARPWVPQHRERVFIIGFREPLLFFDWDLIERPSTSPRLRDILHRGDEEPEEPYTIRHRGRAAVNPKYTLTDHLWKYLQRYAAKHRAAGNGFGFSVFGPSDTARTLSARYFKDGSEILIAQRNQNPRRLTPRECARLMGFDRRDPDNPTKWIAISANPESARIGAMPVRIPVSDTRAYKQFGNSVVVPVVRAIARQLLLTLGVQIEEPLPAPVTPS
jgi:DNA (cytosine-5)-methyltransferase 1